MAYNDANYYTMNPHFFTPDTFGFPVDTGSVVTPQPVVVNTATSSATGTIPGSGLVTALEFWISPTTNESDYQLFQTVYPGGGTVFTNGTDVSISLTTLPTYTGYFLNRAQGLHTVSFFSTGTAFFWQNDPLAGIATTANTALNAENARVNTVTPLQTYYVANSDNTAGSFSGINADTQFTYNTYTVPAHNNLTSPNVTVNSKLSLSPLSAAPANLVAGTISLADNATGGWDPVPIHANTGTPYLAYYDGISWKKIA
jgi:hypothetical protein